MSGLTCEVRWSASMNGARTGGAWGGQHGTQRHAEQRERSAISTASVAPNSAVAVKWR